LGRKKGGEEKEKKQAKTENEGKGGQKKKTREGIKGETLQKLQRENLQGKERGIPCHSKGKCKWSYGPSCSVDFPLNIFIHSTWCTNQ